jgi:ABC-type antimicrobial peptide transport system permease subunit
MVTGEGMALAGIGLALGLAASLLLTRTLSTLLYGVTPRDPVALAGASLLLLAVSAMACLVPAIRAVRVSPAAVLREE